MTPDFALTLSFEGISLLRRVSGGWAPVGDVALDAADLRCALAALRSDADALSPDGGKVKLIIPNEQIKYLSFPDGGQTGDALQRDIRAALDGATPYTVDELRYDWSHKDGQIHVAAVANETLDEAEAFAKSHHFDPVCYVATAPDGEFLGDVFFGTAASWTGATPQKDIEPMVIVAAPVVPPQPAVLDEQIDDSGDTQDPEHPAVLALPTTEPEIEAEPQIDTAADDTSPDADAALVPGIADADAYEEPAQIPEPPSPPVAPQPTLTPPSVDASPPPSFASIRASREAPSPADPPAAPRVDATTADAQAAPRFKLGGARKSTRDSDVTAPVLQVDAIEEPADRKGLGFFSRRKAKAPKIDATADKPVPPVAETAPPPPAPAAPTARHDPEPARAALARIAAIRARSKNDPEHEVETPVRDERARMTMFGARTEPQIGGKPRFLGLMLTSALLIFLLAVAAWASVFLDEGISRFFDRDSDTPSIARLPDVELLPLDGSVTAPPDEDTGLQIAGLEVIEAPSDTMGGLTDVLPPPAALTPEEADARYAATGIWQRSPEEPSTPTQTTLDDLYVASIDGRVQQFDAIALPGTDSLRNDQTYLSQPNPAAPGTRFTLDDRGLVIATPEGAVNPDGVRIFAGLPPVVPPARPIQDVAPTTPTDDAATSTVAPELEQFRPRLRPGGLIEGNERAQLAGRTLAELAALRPVARPETLKAEEEQSQPEATQFAVVQSVAPVTRPRNFSQIVEKTRATQQSAPAEVTQVAAVAPRTVQPNIPSTANVARQATVSNAINLRRINLIGIYGKSSNRRALVRLSNGRYQKVKVGDRLDGGRVAAISESALQYSKNGRNVVLDMPDG